MRDDWESKRSDFEQKTSSLLGVPWSFPVDYSTIWSYAEDGYAKQNPGDLVSSYASSFIENLERYLAKHGQGGADELNRVAHMHAIILAHTDRSDVGYSGTEIVDGIFRIVFTSGNLGVNIYDSSEDILGAVNKAGQAAADAAPGGASSALDFQAKSNIASEWDAKVSSLQEDFKKILDAPVITLSPNFEENAAKLTAFQKANPKDHDLRDDWKARIGEHTYEYFDEGRKHLRAKDFDTDDMMQDGFKDTVEKMEISLTVVEWSESETYNDLKVENGVLVIKVTNKYWAVNVGDPFTKIVDVL